jgi:hypothetical protein
MRFLEVGVLEIGVVFSKSLGAGRLPLIFFLRMDQIVELIFGY